jgi:hypothetical protein
MSLHRLHDVRAVPEIRDNKDAKLLQTYRTNK